MKNLSREQWIQRFREIQGDWYVYDKVKETCHAGNRINIIFRKHGVFFLRIKDHWLGREYKNVSDSQLLTNKRLLKNLVWFIGINMIIPKLII